MEGHYSSFSFAACILVLSRQHMKTVTIQMRLCGFLKPELEPNLLLFVCSNVSLARRPHILPCTFSPEGEGEVRQLGSGVPKLTFDGSIRFLQQKQTHPVVESSKQAARFCLIYKLHKLTIPFPVTETVSENLQVA